MKPHLNGKFGHIFCESIPVVPLKDNKCKSNVSKNCNLSLGHVSNGTNSPYFDLYFPSYAMTKLHFWCQSSYAKVGYKDVLGSLIQVLKLENWPQTWFGTKFMQFTHI